MTNDTSDTKNLARSYCPDCEPAADPLTEILQTRWCTDHEPKRDGLDDAEAHTDRMLSGSGDAEAHDCRVIQSFIR